MISLFCAIRRCAPRTFRAAVCFSLSSVMVTFMSSVYGAPIFNASTKTLPNGLQIVVIPNHMAPVVSVGIVYKVGTADDPRPMHGLSHFLEHLMFKGTKDVPTDQFKKQIITRGGQINAYTTQDVTVYTADIAVEHLELLLKLEADRMQNLAFKDAEVTSECKVVLEERKMRMDNNPFGAAYEALLKTIFWHHPYGVPPIGYDYHIKAYTADAAREHYQAWYTPSNAILVVAGDITLEALMPMAEKYFGPIPSKAPPARNRLPEPDHSGIEMSVQQRSPRISLTMTLWSFAAPQQHKLTSEHYYPLQVLAQILGGNTLSRLYQSLVEDHKLAVNVNANYSAQSIDPETFSISATLAPGADHQRLKKAVEKHVRDLINKDVTDEELESAKRDLLAGFAFARDGNSGCVEAFTSLAFGFTVEDIEAMPEKIRAVTKEQVRKAAQAILGVKPVSIATVFSSQEPETPYQDDPIQIEPLKKVN